MFLSVNDQEIGGVERLTVSENYDTSATTHCSHGTPYGPNCGGLYPSAFAVGTT